MDKRRHEWRSLPAMGISAALFLLFAVFGVQEKKHIIGSAALCVFYIVLIYFLMKTKTARARTAVRAAFLLVILTELSITTYTGVKTVGTTDRDEYYKGYKQIHALLNKRGKTGIDFYRTDTDQLYISNGPYFYNYNGLSLFSSTINLNVMEFMQGLGLDRSQSFYNSYLYTEPSHLTNAFLNMRYMIGRSITVDKNIYWETIGKAGDYLLLENRYYLPLGFMVNGELAGYKRHEAPFLSQNNFFRLATGLNGDLFTIINTVDLVENEEKWNIMVTGDYQIPVTGMAYAYCIVDELDSHEPLKHLARYIIEIYLNETKLLQFTIPSNSPLIFPVGNAAQGDNVGFVLSTNKASIFVGHLNSELFEQGYAKLASQPLNLTKFTNTQVCGNVTAVEDGLLYTSIPADKNWSVCVDGVKSEIVLIDGAMAAVRLNKGYHEVEFRYFNKSLLVGIIVSLVSLAVFIVLIVLNIRKRHSSEI